MKKYLILLSFLLCLPTLSSSQNYMFDDLSYWYTKSKDSLNNEEYIDTIFYKFRFRKKYLYKKKYLGRVTWQCGLLNDTMDLRISSWFPRKRSNTLSFKAYSPNIITVDNKFFFTFKIPVMDLRLKEINHADFTSSYSIKYYEDNNWTPASFETPVCFGPLSISEFERLIKLKPKHWIRISR